MAGHDRQRVVTRLAALFCLLFVRPAQAEPIMDDLTSWLKADAGWSCST